MSIPLSTRCLTPTIDRDIVNRFSQSRPIDKDKIICDVMSIWDLIVDCFNNHDHYIALSILYDLVQQEKSNDDPKLTWEDRHHIADKVAVQTSELERLIKADAFSVKMSSDDRDGFIYQVTTIVENSSYKEWLNHGRYGSAPVIWRFKVKVIDDMNVAKIWGNMRWAFPNIAFMDWLQAMKALNSVADSNFYIAYRYRNFKLLAQMARVNEDRFRIDVTEITSDSRSLNVGFIFDDVLLFHATTRRYSRFGEFLWANFRAIKSPDEAVPRRGPTETQPFYKRILHGSRHPDRDSLSASESIDISGGNHGFPPTDADLFEDDRPEVDPDSLREHKNLDLDTRPERSSVYAESDDGVDDVLPEYGGSEQYVAGRRESVSDNGLQRELGSDDEEDIFDSN